MKVGLASNESYYLYSADSGHHGKMLDPNFSETADAVYFQDVLNEYDKFR